MGEPFYFSFCSLCPIVEPSMHSYDLNFFVSVSFEMPFVRACSPTSLECPSMFWALSLSSFFVFCPKGSCFSLHHCSRRPTCLYLYLPIFASRHSSFGKLPLGPPPLLHFVLGCYDLRFRRCTLSHFVILCLLTFHFSPRGRIVLFYSWLLSLRFWSSYTFLTGPLSFSELHRTPDIVQGRRLEKFSIPNLPFPISFESPICFPWFVFFACL